MNGRLFGIFSPRGVRSRVRRPRLGQGEPLERRSMLTATFLDGVLTVTGTEAADAIVLSTVKENGQVTHGAVRVRGVAEVFHDVESVVVYALGGNDRVVVKPGLRSHAGVAIPVTVDAGEGHDVVTCGDGDDHVSGGSGRDRVFGGLGDDSIDGGEDDDSLHGNGGDDAVLGGMGRDQIHGGIGDDSLYGGQADDRLFGQPGNDDLDGEEGHDRLLGGLGNDDDVDDDDGLRDMSRRGDDSGDNDNLDEDENDDLDDDDGDFEDDDGEDDVGDDDAPVGDTIQFIDGAATLLGTSTSKHDKMFYVFTLDASRKLGVTLQDVADGRYPDVEIERQGSGVEAGGEIEPSDGDDPAAEFDLPAGTYSLRVRSPDLSPVAFSIALLLT